MTQTEIKVPDIGDFSGIPVIEILVKEGDNITVDDSLITLESDKATMEVPSPSAGTVGKLLLKVGDEVSEGTPILMLDEISGEKAVNKKANGAGESKIAQETPGESASVKSSNKKKAGKTADESSGNVSAKDNKDKQKTAPMLVADRVIPVAGLPDADMREVINVFAGPAARRLARELNVDLGAVTATGAKGRVTRSDVIRYYNQLGGGGQQAGGAIPQVPVIDFSQFGRTETVSLSRIKRISGPALHRSWLNLPHVTCHEEADITELDSYRREMDTDAKKKGYRVTLLAFLIKCAANALAKHWEVNSSVAPDGASLIRKYYYHIAFAVDTEHGLLVPVIRDADKKDITEISLELANLSEKARAGKLSPAEMSGATFTISSLGGIGGTGFTPIVNAPEVAILGVNRAKVTPYWNGKEFLPRFMLPFSLSFDHRAIDGALAARFNASMRYYLEDIKRLL